MASEDVEPIPFINLESEEEDQDLAWARADYHTTEQARESAEQARDSAYAENPRKAMALSLAEQEGEIKHKGKVKGMGKVPMEVQGKGRSKDPIEVDDDDDSCMYFKQLWID